MKRILVMILALLFVGSACAETIDWTQYTDEELIAMRSAINAELAGRTAPPEASPLDDFVIVSNGKEARVRSYTGSAADVVIPAEYEGVPVTSIGDEAFVNNDLIVSVYIPGSVQQIGTRAFHDCNSLSSVTFGDSDGSLTIGEEAFFCDYDPAKGSLRTVGFSHTPYSSLSLGNRVFYCAAVDGVVVLSADTVSLGILPFGYVKQMDGLIILADNIVLETSVVSNCDSLDYICMPEDATLRLAGWKKEELKDLPACTTLLLPDRVTGVSEATFANTPNMTIYCSPDSNAIAPCQAVFMPVNTKDYQQKAAELLQIAADLGYVW